MTILFSLKKHVLISIEILFFKQKKKIQREII
jgi:hypothetical protein